MTELPDPRQTDAWGIDRYYEDAFGQWHETPAEAREAILKAMEADTDAPGPTAQPRPSSLRSLATCPVALTL